METDVESSGIITFNLTFHGFYHERRLYEMPDESGIFCVYAGREKPASLDVVLRKLIYIGETRKIRTRLINHERRADWLQHVYSDERLWFSYALSDFDERLQLEQALVFHHQPPENRSYVDTYDQPPTKVNLFGDIPLLNKKFSVAPSE